MKERRCKSRATALVAVLDPSSRQQSRLAHGPEKARVRVREASAAHRGFCGSQSAFSASKPPTFHMLSARGAKCGQRAEPSTRHSNLTSRSKTRPAGLPYYRRMWPRLTIFAAITILGLCCELKVQAVPLGSWAMTTTCMPPALRFAELRSQEHRGLHRRRPSFTVFER